MYFSKQISFFCKTMKRRLANVLEVYRPLFENKHKTMLGKGRFQMESAWMGAKSHKTNIWNPCIAIGLYMFSLGKQDYTT